MLKNELKKFMTTMIDKYGLEEVEATCRSDNSGYFPMIDIVNEANEFLNPDYEDINSIIDKLSKKNYRPRELIKIMEDKFYLSEDSIRGIWKKYNNIHFSRSSKYWIRVI